MPRSGGGVQGDRALRIFDSFRHQDLTLAPGSKQSCPNQISVDKRRVGVGKTRVEIDSAFQKFDCTLVLFRLEFRVVPQTAMVALPGVEAVRWLARGALAFAALDIREDRGRNGRGNLVLHSKDIGQVAVKPLGPEMASRSRLD